MFSSIFFLNIFLYFQAKNNKFNFFHIFKNIICDFIILFFFIFFCQCNKIFNSSFFESNFNEFGLLRQIRNIIRIIFSWMHSKNFYNKILVFFIYISSLYLLQDVSRDNESQHRCSFRQRLVHLAKVFRFFISFFIFVSFKINVVFRSRTSRARYISFTIGEANEDMSRPSSLCVFSISPRRRLLRDNNAFPWFI